MDDESNAILDKIRYNFRHSEWLRKLGLYETRFIMYNDSPPPESYDNVDWLALYSCKVVKK